MQSIVAYVRTLLGWCDDNPIVRTSFKRDRNDDDFSSDEESPVLKRLKKMPKTSFPDVMDSKDMWSEEKQNKNVRYIPIQIESGHPSTSTPIDVTSKLGSRFRTVPMKLTSNGPSPVQRPRKHTPVRPVAQPVIVDEDDQQEVTWVEAKPETKKPSKVYINIDDEDEDYENQDDDDDVIFVKAVSSPPPVRPYKFFVKVLCLLEHTVSLKPLLGSLKYIKKPPLLYRGGCKYIKQTFKHPEELIRRVTGNIKPSSIGKPLDIKNLADESAAFRSTLRSQKSALNELKLVEQGLNSIKDNESTKEYDPITVASINSSDSEVEIITSDASTSSSVRIDPINTLKDSYRDRAITSTDWLSKLDSKYRKKRQETQEKLKDARRESDIISKVNYEQKLAHLEHKLKYELSIPESLIEEVQPTVELPALTPEQEKLVNRALGPGPPGQLLVEKFNLRIHRRDLQTLAGLNWLNDEVINFYMNLLMQRSEERKELPRVYATNTFFYPKLMQSGQAGLRRWTRKVDIFAHDLMVVPVHLGVHWCLSLIDFREKKISYLDSMGARNEPCLAALLQYLRDEHLDKKGAAFDDRGWRTENMKDIPQQMNGSDCGMFACTFAEFSSRGARYTFSQAHMPYLRRKAALEILQARLLL
ncbi:unnamed protein product [Danaus chrysippus]|uniref:(African queen) hypothetical protein n=1 Tax=Danaus chrysippus TaxID=151541 RepID=A0A8J2QQ60_9NEOP|nr:unnamed protein product [Danaus chrysippus]